MNGLSRLTYAAAGSVLRWLAAAPLLGGEMLLGWSAACEERAKPDPPRAEP